MQTQKTKRKARDLRLDFFRGMALLIIFINHMPMNALANYTPSRFGWSDSADLFVFLSGCTAALVYQKIFQHSGLAIGATQVLCRCGQLYVAHLQLFFLLAFTCALGNILFAEPDYIGRLRLEFFFDHTTAALPALLSLRYVPNYIDILPLYIAILALVPVVLLLARVHIRMALGFPVALYILARLIGLELPADPLSDRSWFFNPFCWQLIFFTGFAIYANWVKTPAPNKALFLLCCVFVFVSMPLSHEPSYGHLGVLRDLHHTLASVAEKSHFGPLRWLHLMALAYIAKCCLSSRQALLNTTLPRWIGRLGQHALPMFQLGAVLSFIGGMVLDQTHYTWTSLIAVNLGGCLLLIASAQLLSRRKLRLRQPTASPVVALNVAS